MRSLAALWLGALISLGWSQESEPAPVPEAEVPDKAESQSAVPEETTPSSTESAPTQTETTTPSTQGESASDGAVNPVLGPEEEDLWSQGTLVTTFNQADFDIPVVVNARVISFLKFFTGPGRPTYAAWMMRAPNFRPAMYKTLSAMGLPRDLVYLSMIESGYTVRAYSHAGAAGLWQFIPSTARSHGLRVGRWVDERLDPAKSTVAAGDFLSWLYARYGDWYLAWAAYNCGPLCVDGAMRRTKSRDFWTLCDKKALPLETRNYVPKLLAAAIIGKHPQRYGFTDIASQARRAPVYPVVQVDASIGLDVVAACFETNTTRLATINPHLLLFELPPDGSPVSVRVPMETADAFQCMRLLR